MMKQLQTHSFLRYATLIFILNGFMSAAGLSQTEPAVSVDPEVSFRTFDDKHFVKPLLRSFSSG
jgi:hypothetical protein